MNMIATIYNKHCILRQTYRCRYMGGGGGGRLSDFLSVSVPFPLQFCTLTASSLRATSNHTSALLSLSPTSIQLLFGALSNRVGGGRTASEDVF